MAKKNERKKERKGENRQNLASCIIVCRGYYKCRCIFFKVAHWKLLTWTWRPPSCGVSSNDPGITYKMTP